MSETIDSTVHEADGHAAPAGPGDVEGLNVRGKLKKPIRFSQNSKYLLIAGACIVIGIFVYGFVSNGNGKTTTTTIGSGPQLATQGKVSTTDSEIDKIVSQAPKGVNDTKNGLPPLPVDPANTNPSQTQGAPRGGQDALGKAFDQATKNGDSGIPNSNGQNKSAGASAGSGKNTNTTNFDVSGPNIPPQIVPNAGPTGGTSVGSSLAAAATSTEAARQTRGDSNSLYVGSGNKGQADGAALPTANESSGQGNAQGQPRAAAILNSGESSASGAQGGGGGGVSSAISFANGQGERPAYLTTTQLRPVGKFELWAGSIIPALLDTGINTDLPGPVIAHVNQDVYDSKTGQTLLIPKGSRLIGRYNSTVQNGQSRVQVVWDRLIWTDGKFISLGGQIGAEPEGQSGLYADVNDHRGRILTASIFTAIISAGAQILANKGGASNTTTSTTTPTGQVVEQSVGGNLAQTGQTFINKQANDPPELTVPKGKPFDVLLDRTVVLPAWRYE